MKIIAHTADWCDIDKLDGIDLIDKEKLAITFPDKKVRRIPIKVEKGSYQASDHGLPCTLPTSKAYAQVEIYGMPVRLPLAGLKATRIGTRKVKRKKK